MTASTTTALWVDGTSFLYRAYHAAPRLSSRSGEPTGAILTMASMIRRLGVDYPATRRAIVFDAKGPTFRHALYPDYKANRPSMPDELAAQIEPLKALLQAMGWRILSITGVEADDVIASLCRLAETASLHSYVATGDKDLAQLVGPWVSLVNTMNNEVLDRDGVIAKFGVPPEAIVDYLALVGDSSDNVPGVAQCGPKTAAKWLNQYGSLQAIVAAAESISGKPGESLRAQRDLFATTVPLLTVKRDVPLPCVLDELLPLPLDLTTVISLCQHYGLKRLLSEISASDASPIAASSTATSPTPDTALRSAATPLSEASHRQGYVTISNDEQLSAWLQRLDTAELVALDCETTSLDLFDARLVGISFATAAGEAAYLPLGHGLLATEQLPLAATLGRLTPWLSNPNRPKVLQNGKYDSHVFANYGIALQGIVHDTMLLSYVLESDRPHDLSSLTAFHLGLPTIEYSDLCGKGAKQISFADVTIDQATLYAAEDADMTLRLAHKLAPLLAGEAAVPSLAFVYHAIELPSREVLYAMERQGVLIDRTALETHSIDLAEQMQSLSEQIFTLAGGPFNLNSPRQLGEVLFDRLGLPSRKKTAGGAASTDEEVLSELALDYPIAAAVQHYRQCAKLKNTYTDILPTMIKPQTGRVHTRFSQSTVATGRLSSSDPNLQNIPVRTEAGRRIRAAFVAPPGSRLISADYSQIELRIMAHLSQDPGFLAAFAAGDDIHRATAADIFAIAKSEVSAEQRRIAKSINFGLIYGMSAFGLARQLGIERRAAQTYIDRYFARYPGVLVHMERTRQQVHQNGFVDTLFGRRLRFAGLATMNAVRKSAAERAAINAPIQGTAADLIKLAMIAVHRWLGEAKLTSKLILQVHDELILETPESEIALVSERLPQLMAGVAELSVPLIADVGVGASWDEAH